MPQGDADHLTDQKERIYRQLQREADKLEKERAEKRRLNSGLPSADETTSSTSGIIQTVVPFRWGDLFKSAAFGGCIGAITGAVFGFMDSMRLAGQSEVLKNASNMAKGKYMMEGTTRSATLFGVFFGGFHTVKYGLRVTMDPGEYSEIGLAGVISLGALMSKPSYRAAMPYGTMLILMDSVHLIMRDFDMN
jgi:hypothetical protein